MPFLHVLALIGSLAQVWLTASDLHLDPFDTGPDVSAYGSDTDVALYQSTLAAMKRAVPNPAVVVIPGDFLAHDWAARSRRNGASAEAAALEVARRVAADFGRAFPHATFAIAMGNNDSPCGDYRTENGSKYARELAKIWAPLVDRNGASPAFVHTFAGGGYYVSNAAPGVRLVVINTVAFSRLYRGDCNSSPGGTPKAQLAWLRERFADPANGRRDVIVMHVPFGYDAFTTETAHGFVAWPFLGRDGGALTSLLSENERRIAFVIAGHVHHFDVRFDGGIPAIVLGSISPVYHNNPAFYAFHVGSDATLRDIDEYAYDDDALVWEAPRSFDRLWGVEQINAQTLATIHAALADDAAMRARWEAQSVGWPPDPSGTWGQWSHTWPIAWCAQTEIGSGFAHCAGIERRTGFGIALLAAIGAAVLAAAVGVGMLLFRLWRGRRIVSVFRD